MKKLIIGNWKLNPVTLKEAIVLASKINSKSRHTAVICPPTLFISQIKYPKLGAQDCFWMAKGPFTGQVSATSLKDLKVTYCIVGHSERRETGDSDQNINLKVKALLDNKITPVLCIGHGTVAGEDELDVIDVLKQQLKVGLSGIDSAKVVVAYEPVWAIGKGKPATPEHVEKIAMFVKNKFGAGKVLYGGSVNSQNAREFLTEPNIDGLLVGGASLLAEDFNKIINTKV